MKKGMSFCVLMVTIPYICANNLEKVVYCGQSSPDMLQKGVLELYFARTVQQLPMQSKSNGQTITMQFSLADVAVKPSDIAAINGIQGAGYTVKMHSNVHKQYDLVITYDVTRVLVAYAPTISIDMQHGLVIRFFDQEVLQKMRNQDKPILCVAFLNILANV